SDMLLPSMMTILNERLFHNGHRVAKCPLITAVATTNFLNEDDELAAFNDRWLIRMNVQPLETLSQQIEMLQRAVSGERLPPTETVYLSDIMLLNDYASTLPIDDGVIDLYAELAAEYRKTFAPVPRYISDRRLAAAFKLARARAVLSGAAKVSHEHLEAVRFGLSIVGKDSELTFLNVFQHIVGDIETSSKERQELRILDSAVEKLTADFDSFNDRETTQR